MRFGFVLFLAAVIFAAPVWGQDSSSAPGHVFGSATCRQAIPCPGSAAQMSPAALAASANACVTQNFGFASPSGFFDESYGLDSDNCLTLKPELAGKGTPPQCCVITMADNTCSFQCKLVAH